MVIKGYLPIALTLRLRRISWLVDMSCSLAAISAMRTLASVDLKVMVISCFFFGAIVPIN